MVGTLAAEFEVLVFACLNGDQNISKKKIYFFAMFSSFCFLETSGHLGLGDDGQRCGKVLAEGLGGARGGAGKGGERFLSCSELRVSFG